MFTVTDWLCAVATASGSVADAIAALPIEALMLSQVPSH
jgi:hypothetical protein